MSIILIIFAAIFIFIYGWIKINYRFWSIQPVFQIYNIYYWLFYSGIIENDIEKNKYYDPTIKTDSMIVTDNFITFIQKYFLQSENISYIPEKRHIEYYFKNDVKALCSTSYDEQKNIIGYITSRTIKVYLKNKEMECYYVDFLCIDKMFRNKYVAPKMIQTHIYNQRKLHNKKIGIFKREGRLSIIVPIVIYRTYGLVVYNWIQKANITTIKITKNMLREVIDIIKTSNFSFKILPSYSILLDLIEHDVVLIYAIIVNKSIAALYFLRDGGSKYNNKKSVECLGSINIMTTNEIFVEGFINVINKINIPFLWIENLAYNSILIKYIINNHNIAAISPMAYYYHNYAAMPYIEKNVFILC